MPIDKHCSVPGTGGRVFAAGDAANYPIKHGGLGAQMADAAAAAIAVLAGAQTTGAAFNPVIRGKLLTGRDPRLHERASRRRRELRVRGLRHAAVAGRREGRRGGARARTSRGSTRAADAAPAAVDGAASGRATPVGYGAAVAMDGRGLDEQRLRLLLEVGTSIVAELDSEAVLQRVLEAGRELTGARYAAVGILDSERRGAGALPDRRHRRADAAGDRRPSTRAAASSAS